MKFEKKVSIIMPVYNSEKYLKESIESILDQTYKNFEFIIIYDKSTDKSFELIEQYSQIDSRIVTIFGDGKGLVNALNKGLFAAKGEYIARMDSDDISVNERIEKQFDFLEENRDIDILGTCLEAFGDITEEQKKSYNQGFSKEINPNNLEEIFLETCPLPHPSVMFRSEILKKLNGYKEKYRCAEDYDLWLRAIREGYKIAKLNEYLIKYRVHNESKTAIEVLNHKIIIEYTMKARIAYIKNIKKKDKVDYLIWGASNGGKFVKELLDDGAKNFNLIGYIDKYKEGDLNGIRIYKPTELTEIQFDYIFIATAPGKKEANEFLDFNNFKKVKEYINLV